MHNVVPFEEIPPKQSVIDVPVEDLKPLYKLCLEMERICTKANGVGLSALQIGIPWRLFIAIKDARDISKFRYFINSEYTPLTENKILSVEGCLSLPNTVSPGYRQFRVRRYERIRLRGKELVAEDSLRLVDVDETFDGLLAIVYQHECDHHTGVLISDHGEEIVVW